MRCLHSFLVLLVVAGTGVAQPPPRTHTITPDDYSSIAVPTELAVSPDGKQVAYCLATWDTKADNRRTDLWVMAADGKSKPRPLTTDRANDRHPKWSADGKAVYVLRNHRQDGKKEPPFDGSTQVWKVPVEDGKPTAVTSIKTGVSGYDYAPAADAVFYTVDDETTDTGDFAKLRARYDTLEYGHGKRKVSEVFRLGGGEEKAEKVIAEKRYIRGFAVTRDGKRVAMISALDDSVLKSEGESRVDVWEDGKVVTPPTEAYRKKAASPWAWLESLTLSPDGKQFAFCAIFDGYPAEVVVGGQGSDGQWSTRLLDRAAVHVRGYGTPLHWLRAGPQLGGLVESQGSVARVGFLTGKSDSLTGTIGITLPSVVVSAYDSVATTAGPQEFMVVATPTEFAEIGTYTGNADSPYRTLTDLNPQTATWKLPSVRHVTWKAADGTEVGGVLELPPDFKKGDKKLPLVVAIHGGPTTATHTELTFDPHNGRLYFSARGYAVLCPNYRGSTGYGDKFVTDLIGRENDIEVKDILAGIQHLIAEGIVDPDRVGVMGWSNGGYLTNCLISLKDSPVKFRAASSGAGIVDTVAEWGFNDEPAYPRVFKKGLPWETPDVYKKTSPTYQLGNVKTPTLIHVGGGDERCPPGHSRMLYRALKEYVDVPTQLVVYPGEPHGLTKYSHRKAKMEWDLAWFDKYLLGKN